MPRYTYRCLECKEKIVIHHSTSDKQHNCELCDSTDTLERIPVTINLYKTEITRQTEPGNIVKEHIEDIREEIDNMKEKFKRSWTEDE
jgi:protein involved in sex pheromone biosynthesis